MVLRKAIRGKAQEFGLTSKSLKSFKSDFKLLIYHES